MMSEEDRVETLRVTVAVGLWVDERGTWRAYGVGWDGEDRVEMKNAAIDTSEVMMGPVCWRFITADVPVPQNHEPTLEGTVILENDAGP